MVRLRRTLLITLCRERFLCQTQSQLDTSDQLMAPKPFTKSPIRHSSYSGLPEDVPIEGCSIDCFSALRHMAADILPRFWFQLQPHDGKHRQILRLSRTLSPKSLPLTSSSLFAHHLQWPYHFTRLYGNRMATCHQAMHPGLRFSYGSTLRLMPTPSQIQARTSCPFLIFILVCHRQAPISVALRSARTPVA